MPETGEALGDALERLVVTLELRFQTVLDALTAAVERGDLTPEAAERIGEEITEAFEISSEVQTNA